jgi:hypothetical protein
MKPAIGILFFGLALAACGSPPPRQAPAPKAEDPVAATRALFGTDDWDLIGGKCVAILELPANAGQTGNDAAHARWKTWLEGSQPELAAQMVNLNRQTYAASPEGTLTAAATYCRGKIDEVKPVVAPAS